MKKLLFVYFIFVQLLFGYNYNDLLSKAESSIFPKIMLLDKKVKDKLVNNKIVYTIIHDSNDYQTALKIKKYIDDNYKGYFGEYPYEIHIVDFTNILNTTPASAFYVLKSSTENIKKIAKAGKKKGVVTFSYDVNNLKDGLLFSLMIEKSTILYLNRKYLDINKIEFVDSLLQMVQFLSTEE